jgi:hypothetical protein
MNRPAWNAQWDPAARPALSFGSDDPAAARVVRLDGGFVPAPVPPGFNPAALPSFRPPVTPAAKDGSYGRRAQTTLPDLPGAQIEIFSNDLFPGMPMPRSIQLYRSDRDTVYGNADVRALIQYANGGIWNAFRCDWINGGQFSLVCTSIRVIAETYAPAGDQPYSVGSGELILGALVGDGAAAPQGDPVSFTTERRVLAPGPSELEELIPDFARRFVPCMLDTAGALPPVPADFIIRFLTGSANVIKATQLTAEIERDGIIIPGGANSVVVASASALEYALAFQFQLGL